ncbi:uncharacterized protein (DUF488 family) [Streptosporangium becharense]|uniref:Uncharacterized protein (DUF488 family) n=1 Tax=Streptosporangium becharense TaxID=1816182 RepID=A0A7W9IDB5_9ACTN|nr:DUF488 domain-containing protein [Streptosporangium becharense]MBB2913009.1 uncharacterized protein (DUF488 family) [Streptosporangium becharense]MBB5818166.1 uncharacterized protein (DUF488 family) [Streptosporangium becharense]
MFSDQDTGIVGIGYEGRDLESVVKDALAYDLTTLIDVRLNPISRKPGLSKRRLAAAMAENGIEYVHMPQLGNPRWNRAGFAGSAAELTEARDNYAAHVASSEAEAAMDEIAVWAQKGLVAVLCFEADERRCHRSVVLDQVRRRLPGIL